MGQLALCTAAAKNGKMLQRHMAKRTYSYSYYPGDIVRLARGMAGSAFLAIEHGNILCAINSRNTLLGETFVVINKHGRVVSGAPGESPSLDDLFIIIGMKLIGEGLERRRLVFVHNVITSTVGLLWEGEIFEPS